MENEKIIVVFCNWKRLYRVDEIFTNLSNQTYKNFDLVIWNNNINDKIFLKNISLKYNINTNIINSKINIGGIGRFYAIKEQVNKYSKFIFFDDDQKLPNDFIENMLKFYEDKTIKSRYGWRLNSDYYFDRTRIFDNTEVQYCGTGGMIGDINIFKNDILYNIPEKYKFVEDLWLSYISNNIGFKNYGIPETIEQLIDGNDQFKLIKNIKIEFLKELVNKYKWHY